MENLSELAVWEHPASGMRISMRAAVVRMLASESLHRLRAEQPSELGGILRGTFHRDEIGRITASLDPQVVPSRSHLYNTNEEDRRRLVAALQDDRGNGRPAIGYFRSHVRDGFCLSPQDALLVQQYLRDPHAIFLLIRPFENGICVAGFFFWEQDRLQTDVSDFKVPFVAPGTGEQVATPYRPTEFEYLSRPEETLDKGPNPSLRDGSARPVAEPELGGQETEIEATAARVTNLPVHSEEKQHFHRPPAKPNLQAGGVEDQTSLGPDISRPRRTRATPWIFIGLVSLLLGLCTGLYVGLTKSGLYMLLLPDTGSKLEIGLRVRAAPGGQLDLSWDKSSPRLQKAESAKLAIVDGKSYRELYLDKAQLRFGSLTYFSDSDDVQFSLEVHIDSARSVTESIRVLPHRSGSPSLSREARAEDTTRTEPGSQPVTVQTGSATPYTMDSTSVNPTSQPHSGTVHVSANPTAKRVAGKLYIPLAAPPVARPSLSSVLPPPPLEILASGLNSFIPDISVAARPLPSPPPPAIPPTVVTAMPKEVSRAYVPARPIRQVMPSRTSLGVPTIHRPIDITVQVKIDEHGRVTEAHSTSRTNTDSTLVMQAISAARQWTFEPAKLRDKNIASDHTIVFRFRPLE